MGESPIILRRTSRIVLVSPESRFLLMMTQAPDSSGFSRWITPGGGVEHGESHQEAAVRELFEETGLSIPVTPEPFWTHEFDVSWDQANHNRGYAEYFVAFSENEFEPASDFWTPEERIEVTESRWWSIEALSATTDPYEPLHLPELFSRVLSAYQRL